MTRPETTRPTLLGTELAVSDLERARHFYVHALGFLPAPRDPGQAANDDRLTLAMGEYAITLRESAHAQGVMVPETAVMLLNVDDWCTISERLQAHGVLSEVLPGRRFSTVPGEQCTLSVLDPDGNTIELRGFAAEDNQLAA